MERRGKRSASLLFVQEGRAYELMTSVTQVNATTETSNSITRFLHLEPARFWKCWRRFDDIGRRYVDFRKG
jgi:hypothetical protein